jgi:iron(III) transport system ATP-binding protein
LSNLDAQLRLAMRAEFKALQRRLELTAIYVTHDQEEALVLSDRILVMRDGIIEQEGTPAEIHGLPKSRFVAEFVGVSNILPCDVAGPQDAAIAVLADGLRLPVRTNGLHGSARICFRPINVRLSPTQGGFGHPATVTTLSYLGDLVQYELRSFGLTIQARGMPDPSLVEGAEVFWSVAPDSCFLVPEST